MEAVEAACRERSLEWSRRLREALDSSLRFLAAEPTIAGILGAAAPAAEPAIAEARERLVERLAALLAEGREHRDPSSYELPAEFERLAVAAALTVVSERVTEGEHEQLPRLSPDLAALLTFAAP